MHYYIYISALQPGQIRRETERPKPTKKKSYPVESAQGITVKRPWTSPTPYEATPNTVLPCQSRKQTLVENIIFISNFIQNVCSLQVPNKYKYFNFFLQIQAIQLFENDSFTSIQVVPTPTKVAKITAEYLPLPSVFPKNVNQDTTVNKKVIPGTPEVNISCTIKLFFCLSKIIFSSSP